MGGVCGKPKVIDFESEASLFHFSLLQIVGKGAFGKVRIVKHKKTQEVYALKYINKNQCVNMRAVSNILRERKILEEVNHPYIVNLRYAFQDDENCFFVLDLMLGGDLRFHLARLGSFPEDTVRIYVAQIASALAYMHGLGIVHRDVKPDNILLDDHGNAHLTDFNVAVQTRHRKIRGISGTKPYMAPELLMNKKYTYKIDWWSLGICAYELIFGRQPFKSTEHIMNRPLTFPKGMEETCTPNGLHVLCGLLDRDPSSRLGLHNLRRHQWFKNINWEKLDAKELSPSFIPHANRPNFEASLQIEEILLDSKPLKAKARKKSKVDKRTAEMSWLDKEFATYDFRKIDVQHRRAQDSKAHRSKTSATVPLQSRPMTPAANYVGDQTGSFKEGEPRTHSTSSTVRSNDTGVPCTLPPS